MTTAIDSSLLKSIFINGSAETTSNSGVPTTLADLGLSTDGVELGTGSGHNDETRMGTALAAFLGLGGIAAAAGIGYGIYAAYESLTAVEAAEGANNASSTTTPSTAASFDSASSIEAASNNSSKSGAAYQNVVDLVQQKAPPGAQDAAMFVYADALAREAKSVGGGPANVASVTNAATAAMAGIPGADVNDAVKARIQEVVSDILGK